MITNFRTAYKIGFSYGLNFSSYSAYADCARVKFDNTKHQSLARAFCRGWRDGYSEQRRERILFSRDRVVRSVYVSYLGELIGVETLVAEDIISDVA